MMKKEERVLLYQFPEEQIVTAHDALRALGIRVQILPADAWREKVGYLLGYKGYKAALPQEDTYFDFSHRLLLLEHIQGKRLTKVLLALEEAGIPRITYKSAITPYNTLWTLRYLCEHMAKEHAATGGDREGDI
ncbi:DUF3783 domain-containing protein [Selenomonas sp. oral taxon 138]|uniref:DUF3783 domain-containing protein n=1 Tax=Selenomonas sp. oral taxon 138 TaxID=712532 RepID=UPI0002A2561D|nr:DUF3783 domain-containing protein [Selenomonas sp. oral taxon 138]EKX98697.1 hypothetical protein HMPREF9163_00919 [Selenomonas sp. oral taxon 138 str. F0429]